MEKALEEKRERLRELIDYANDQLTKHSENDQFDLSVHAGEVIQRAERALYFNDGEKIDISIQELENIKTGL